MHSKGHVAGRDQITKGGPVHSFRASSIAAEVARSRRQQATQGRDVFGAEQRGYHANRQRARVDRACGHHHVCPAQVLLRHVPGGLDRRDVDVGKLVAQSGDQQPGCGAALAANDQHPALPALLGPHVLHGRGQVHGNVAYLFRRNGLADLGGQDVRAALGDLVDVTIVLLNVFEQGIGNGQPCLQAMPGRPQMTDQIATQLLVHFEPGMQIRRASSSTASTIVFSSSSHGSGSPGGSAAFGCRGARASAHAACVQLQFDAVHIAVRKLASQVPFACAQSQFDRIGVRVSDPTLAKTSAWVLRACPWRCGPW